MDMFVMPTILGLLFLIVVIQVGLVCYWLGTKSR